MRGATRRATPIVTAGQGPKGGASRGAIGGRTGTGMKRRRRRRRGGWVRRADSSPNYLARTSSSSSSGRTRAMGTAAVPRPSARRCGPPRPSAGSRPRLRRPRLLGRLLPRLGTPCSRTALRFSRRRLIVMQNVASGVLSHGRPNQDQGKGRMSGTMEQVVNELKRGKMRMRNESCYFAQRIVFDVA